MDSLRQMKEKALALSSFESQLSPMGFVVHPVSLVLHASCQGHLAAAMALVEAPISFVDIAIGAGVSAFPMTQVTKRVALQACPQFITYGWL